MMRIACLLLGAVCAVPAIGAEPAGNPPPPSHLEVGLLARQGPAYLGSDESRVFLFPGFQYSFRRFLRIGDSALHLEAGDLTVTPWRRGPWDCHLTLSLAEGRAEGRAKALAGMGSRGAGAFLGPGFGFENGAFHVTLDTQFGLWNGAGLLAGLRVGSDLPLTEWIGLEFAALAVWGDQKNLAYDFGISPEQARRREILRASGQAELRPADTRPYAPAAAFRETRLTAGFVGQDTSRRRTLFLFADHTRLWGDVARSPLARAPAGLGLTVGIMFRLDGRHVLH